MVTREGEPVKILLADDDEDDRFLFSEALKDVNPCTSLKTVNDGERLMKYLASVDGERPDIIFLDINMPCKDGKECLKEIRSNKELDDVPVIMFSTSNHDKDVDETFKNGANLYVAKPVFFNEQVKILKNIFSLNWQEDLLKPDMKRFVLHAGKI
jgi:CheY-like chemotaxis protein